MNALSDLKIPNRFARVGCLVNVSRHDLEVLRKQDSRNIGGARMLITAAGVCGQYFPRQGQYLLGIGVIALCNL